MTITLIDIIIIFSVTILFNLLFGIIIDSIKSKLFYKKDSSPNISVTPEEKESDMSLIYEALDIFILK